ncbi:MAG: hypothetical protein JST11_00035 [Acidobacteria bacterium]|nr:hypothetical protein [Acidobacteriota bacterium]
MRWSIFCLTAALAFADGTTPKPSPTDYDVHAYAGHFDIGAEYMVHSFSAGEEMFLTERYLVVEVAFYPPLKTDDVTIDLAKFKLRINRKTLISADPPAQAAASLTPSMWDSQQPSRISGGIGAGPVGVGVGQPRPIPGPRPPRAPEADPPGGIERKPVSPEEVLLNTALPGGPHKGPVSGFVYFPFAGKLKSVKSVELVYDSTTLNLK